MGVGLRGLELEMRKQGFRIQPNLNKTSEHRGLINTGSLWFAGVAAVLRGQKSCFEITDCLVTAASTVGSRMVALSPRNSKGQQRRLQGSGV